ncbi:MAG: 3-oxoacyl-ACP synthase III [Desulfobulbus propionicus]|nr:MAG: 3-oxoacyl-ACP synthase III [Desulfobulbus propionicus]
MRYSQVCLHNFGYALPPREITSTAIEEQLESLYDRLNLPAGRLELMSGITSRRLWHPGTRPSQGAILAGRHALEQAGIPPEDLGCLLFTSVCRDMMEPATAAFVHRELGLPQTCQIFDISNACLGFLNGVVVLANMLELGQVRSGLIVAGETAENLVESTLTAMRTDTSLTRKSVKHLFASLTIGSGAVALIMTRKDVLDTGHYLLGGSCRTNTVCNNLCQGGQNSEQGTLMSTESEELLHQGVAVAHACWQDFLSTMGWPAEKIDRFFCHQVGRAHARLLFEKLQLNPEKNFETLPFLGNVGSVSAPITMALGVEQGGIRSGEYAALMGIGSGINAMILALQW